MESLNLSRLIRIMKAAKKKEASTVFIIDPKGHAKPLTKFQRDRKDQTCKNTIFELNHTRKDGVPITDYRTRVLMQNLNYVDVEKLLEKWSRWDFQEPPHLDLNCQELLPSGNHHSAVLTAKYINFILKKAGNDGAPIKKYRNKKRGQKRRPFYVS